MNQNAADYLAAHLSDKMNVEYIDNEYIGTYLGKHYSLDQLRELTFIKNEGLDPKPAANPRNSCDQIREIGVFLQYMRETYGRK